MIFFVKLILMIGVADGNEEDDVIDICPFFELC